MRGGSAPSSMHLTRFLFTPASPMSRSRAIGGQVAIRRAGRIAGCALNTSGVSVVIAFVQSNMRRIACVALPLSSRNATGANFMNQSL